MSLNQLYKYSIFLILLLSIVLSKQVKPNNKEKLYKLTGISENETRSYYLLDDNGLLYSRFTRFGNASEKAIIKIIARSQIAPNSNDRKSFGYKLLIKNGKKTILTKELKYNKKAAQIISPKDKKGFYFTEAGFWIEKINITENLKIYIKPLKGSHDAFIRLTIEDINNREKTDIKIRPLNRQQNFSISFNNEKNTNVKSRDWYLIDSLQKYKFKVYGPTVIRLYSRYVYDIENEDEDYYRLIFYEDERWVSEYLFNKEKSINSAHILSKTLNGLELSKFNSFYFNVPEGTHYYSLKLPKDSIDNKILIKVEAYDIK